MRDDPDPLEPTLRDVFVAQACEVFWDVYEEHTPNPAAVSWDDVPPRERAAFTHAMSALLDWLDTRRL